MKSLSRLDKIKLTQQQYNLDGNFICLYNSAKEASVKTNINHSHICMVCRGESNSAGGYQWIYCKDKNPPETIHKYERYKKTK